MKVRFMTSLAAVRSHEGAEAVRKYVTQSLIGIDCCNYPDPNRPGNYLEDPRLTSHPNRERHKEAHWLINASQEVVFEFDLDADGHLTNGKQVPWEDECSQEDECSR